jgi:hypothetical protein
MWVRTKFREQLLNLSEVSAFEVQEINSKCYKVVAHFRNREVTYAIIDTLDDARDVLDYLEGLVA